MAFCSHCGAAVPVDATFCQQCGHARPTTKSVLHAGLSENVAATLSYVLGWITGIIFYLIDRRPYVRFHAAQSIITFGALSIARVVLGMVFGMGWWFGGLGLARGAIGIPLLSALGLLTLVLWVYCMIRAYQGQRFKLPWAGDLAESLVR